MIIKQLEEYIAAYSMDILALIGACSFLRIIPCKVAFIGKKKKEQEKKLPYRCSGMDSALIFFDRSERFFNHRPHDQVKGGGGKFKKKYQ